MLLVLESLSPRFCKGGAPSPPLAMSEIVSETVEPGGCVLMLVSD
ncbi:MAG: hypothetical protein ABIV39_15875 [Verrucomicrobiota bacterium]